MDLKAITENLAQNIMQDATDAERIKAICNVVRRTFDRKNALEHAAYMIAEREIQPKSKLIHLTLENVSLDDDPDFPTVIIMARENWPGNCEDHTLVIPLEEFVPVYLEAVLI